LSLATEEHNDARETNPDAVGDFAEDYEVTVLFQALQAVGHERAGAEVIKGKRGPPIRPARGRCAWPARRGAA